MTVDFNPAIQVEELVHFSFLSKHTPIDIRMSWNSDKKRSKHPLNFQAI